MPQPIIYRYHLTQRRNLFLGGDLSWLGYSEAEIKALGDLVIEKLIHDDDLHRIEKHHQLCRTLALQQSKEIWFRQWGRKNTPLFCRSIDTCVLLDESGLCEVIEGVQSLVDVGEYDGRKIIERAISRDAFTLHYQPIVLMRTGEIVGHEALARIEFGGSEIAPWRFLPYILGTDLERAWLQQQLLQLIEALPKLPGFVSFNLSSSALAWDDFADVLAVVGGEPRIWFEIVEDAIGTPGQLENLQIIRKFHRIEADDVPTKSSIALMLAAELDGVKLDRSLSHGIHRNVVQYSFAKSIVEIAKQQGLSVVAEGIEDAKDARILQTLNPDIYGQGWLWGKAEPLQ